MATFVTNSSGQMEDKSGASCEISLDKSVLQESKEMQQCPQASKRERETPNRAAILLHLHHLPVPPFNYYT